MALFTELVDDDADVGIRSKDFSLALHVWVNMSCRKVTVAEAALTFNTTPELVREGVKGAYWLCLYEADGDPMKQTIEADGE